MSPPRKKEKKEEVARSPRDSPHSGSIRLTGDASRQYASESNLFKVGDVFWKAGIKCDRPETGLGRSDEYLTATLESYMLNRSPLWSINVKATFKLINVYFGKNITMKKQHTFNSRSALWKVNLVQWKDIIERDDGFVQNGKVTVLINFSTVSKIGSRTLFPPQTNFTDPRHDVALVMEGEKVYASKAILAIYSPVFNIMFYGNFSEKDKNEIELKDIDREVFIEMMNFIYPSSQKITVANAESLMIIADRFQIQTVIDQVEEFLISPGNSGDIRFQIAKMKMANEFRLAKLQTRCMGWFRISKGLIKPQDLDSFIAVDINLSEMAPQIDFTDANDPRHDVVFAFGDGEKIYASKQYLSILSPVFTEKFYGCLTSNTAKEYTFDNICREEFLEMLSVTYPAGPKITDRNVQFLLRLGARFDINRIRDLAENYLISLSWRKRTPDLGLLLLSDRYGLVKLQGRCIDKWLETENTRRETYMASAEYKILSNGLKKVLNP